MKTVQDELRAEDERHAQRKIELAYKDRLLRMLPGELPLPSISNIEPPRETSRTQEAGRVNAWLSFSQSKGRGSEVLLAMEARGWQTLPATLAKYGMYRRRPMVGLQQGLPEMAHNQHLEDSEPIAPLWVEPCQFTEPSAEAFYQAPDGLVCRVHVPSPRAYVGARRVDFKGGWRYERSSGYVWYPLAWKSVAPADDETPLTQVCRHSRGYVDTEQGLSGAIYFTPLMHHPDFPLTAGQFLRRLEELAS